MKARSYIAVPPLTSASAKKKKYEKFRENNRSLSSQRRAGQVNLQKKKTREIDNEYFGRGLFYPIVIILPMIPLIFMDSLLT